MRQNDPLTETDRIHLARCVELARQAVEGGNRPFGSVLVGADGAVLKEDFNRTGSGDPTRHPEFALARWAAESFSPDERRQMTVYTSGEHCPMCAAAHAWVGLGRIVYATTTEQLVGWLDEFGARPLPYRPVSARYLMPDLPMSGPAPEFTDEIKALHERVHRR
ncbi:nucleoside deaminase [Jiella sp. M17.18]|uniref:nucleoside deaminase n=1 Tax=Jiella sp. M17.18 TaxID=3234247 RepID=UPI0034DF4D62